MSVFERSDALVEIASERVEMCLEQASHIAVAWFGKGIIESNLDLIVRLATAMLLRESAEVVSGHFSRPTRTSE